MRLLTAVLAALCMSSALADMNPSICQYNNQQPTKPFPTIPDTFATAIEVNIVPNKTTKNIYEIFDSQNNRAVINEEEQDGNLTLGGRVVYDFNQNQEITLVPVANIYQCVATPIVANDKFVFGTTGSKFTAKSAFRISASHPTQYLGKSKLTELNMNVESWSNCYYADSYDGTFVITYYFTDSNDWNSAIGMPNTPVMMKVEGIANKLGAPNRKVLNTYRFSFFKNFIMDSEYDMFQVPMGTTCPGLKNYLDNPLPPIAQTKTFSFRAELLQADNIISTIREMYDSQMKLSRYDYHPQSIGKLDSPFGDNPVKEIHDFNSGVSYTIDRVRGNCSISALRSGNFDVVETDADHHVRMQTIAEFFAIDRYTTGSQMNWTYTGQRKIRDITADVYVAERFGYPTEQGPDSRSIWELAFISDQYIQTSGDDYEYQEPMRLWIRFPDTDATNPVTISYNIFDFNEEEPDFFHFDVSNCYDLNQKQLVTLQLPGTYIDVVKNNQQTFMYLVLLALETQTDGKPTRFANLEYVITWDNQIELRFYILDEPPMDADGQPSLSKDTIFDQLKSAVDAGTFVVKSADEANNLFKVTAVKGSAKKRDHSYKTGSKTVVQLNGGAAAGIAIGFLIVGAGLGVLAIFLVNKFRGGAPTPNLAMSFSPKTFQNES